MKGLLDEIIVSIRCPGSPFLQRLEGGNLLLARHEVRITERRDKVLGGEVPDASRIVTRGDKLIESILTVRGRFVLEAEVTVDELLFSVFSNDVCMGFTADCRCNS